MEARKQNLFTTCSWVKNILKEIDVSLCHRKVYNHKILNECKYRDYNKLKTTGYNQEREGQIRICWDTIEETVTMGSSLFVLLYVSVIIGGAEVTDINVSSYMP